MAKLDLETATQLEMEAMAMTDVDWTVLAGSSDLSDVQLGLRGFLIGIASVTSMALMNGDTQSRKQHEAVLQATPLGRAVLSLLGPVECFSEPKAPVQH